MEAQLSSGCILDMRNGTTARGQIVQLIDVRKLASSNAGGAQNVERVRLVLSDGVHFLQGMVSQQILDSTNEVVGVNAVVRLDAWAPHSIAGRFIIVIASLSIIHPNVGVRLGSPVALEAEGAKPQAAGAGDAQPHMQQQPPMQAQQQPYGAAAPPAAGSNFGMPPQQQQPQPMQQHPFPLPAQNDPYGGGYQQQPPQMQQYGQPPPQQQQWQQQPPQQQWQQQPQQQPWQQQPQPWQQQPPQQPWQQQQQPPPQQQMGGMGGGANNAFGFGGGGNGAVARSSEDTVTMPISALNPYQNRWAIKGRVTQKGPKKTYTNARGEGTLFSFTLCDADGDIRLTCFNEVALRLHGIVNVGELLLVRNGQIKSANERFNNTSSRYEITLANTSEVTPINDDPHAAASIPAARFNVVPLSALGEMEPEQGQGPPKGLDIMGALLAVGEFSLFTSKAGKELKKRVVTIGDESGFSIELTIWGELAETFAGNPGDVIVAKGARLSSWNGRSMSSSFDGDVFLHPQHERAPKVKAWYDAGGATNVRALTTGGSGGGSGGAAGGPRKTLAAVALEGLGLNKDRPESWSVQATVMLIKSSKELWYCSCAKCKKKVMGDDAQTWSCEACGWSGPECVRRYVGRFQVSDSEGSLWVNAYDEVLSEIMGMSADELCRLKDLDERHYDAHLRDKSFETFLFGMRSVLDEWNNESRSKHSAVSVKKVCYETEARAMLEAIKLSPA